MGGEEEEEEKQPRFPKLKLPLADLLDSDSEHPFQAPASVPFKWEEQPGKPRPCTSATTTRPKPTRSLDLPPCMSSDRFTKTPSPTTVLDGPYAAISRSKFSSFRDDQSFRSPHGATAALLAGRRGDRGFFGKLKGGGGGGGGGSCRFSPASVSSCDIEEAFVGVKKSECGGVKKMKRIGSFSSTISHAKPSQLWTSIYQSIKQVMHWKSSKRSNKESRK